MKWNEDEPPLPGSVAGFSLTQGVYSATVSWTQVRGPGGGQGKRKAQWWVDDVHVALGHFIKFHCDISRKRGPEKGATRPQSQGKPVARAALDLGFLNLLGRWVSRMQMAFSCLAPSRGRCLALHVPLSRLTGAGSERQRAVFHICLCLLTGVASHSLPLWCQAGARPPLIGS